MKTKVKYLVIGLLFGIIITSVSPVLADTFMQKIDVVLNTVNVQIEGNKLDTDTILYNNTTYLPMRKVAEAVGKDIVWNQNTMTANIVEKTDEDTKLNNNINTVQNTELKTSDGIPIKIINGKQYVYTFDYYKVYNNEDNKKINYNLPDGTMIDSKTTDSMNMYINGEEVLTGIPYLNIDWALYIEVDYYENTILPLISE